MATNYSSKLTLQDNFTQVMNKAIKATEKLQKEIKALENKKIHPKVDVKLDNSSVKNVESKLDAIKRNKVNVGAKLDASFDSVMNTINRQTDVEKKIKITAEENVTRTTKNLQRDVFTLERRLKTSIFGGGSLSGNFNVSSPDFINGFSSIVSAINNTANNKDKTSSSFIQDALSNSIGTNAAMVASGITAGKLSNISVQGSKVDVKGLKDNKISSYGNPTILKAIKGGFLDAIKDYKENKAGMIGLKEMYGNQRLSQIFNDFISKAIPSNTKKYAMIEAQKMSMANTRAKYGFSQTQYLPKYQKNSLWTPGFEGEEIEIFSGYTKQMNKVQASIERFRQRLDVLKEKMINTFSNSSLVNSLSNLKNNINNFGSSIKTKLGNAFNFVKGKGEVAFKKVAFSAQRILSSFSYGLSAPFVSIGSKINKVTAKIGGLKGALAVISGKASALPSIFGKWARPINLAGKAINTGFIKPLNIAYSGVKKLAGKAWKMTVNMAGNAFNMLKQMVMWAGTLAGGLVVKGVTDAATIEQYEVSMQHFISNGMKNTQPHLSASQRESVASTETKNFLNTATNLANKTPFTTGEVLQAANRSVGITSGDTEQAKTLLKLASDMASLTPGKSIMDAMEALADLKIGERERLKEFGHKIDNDTFVKAAGLSSGNIADLSEEQMAKAFATLTEEGGLLFEAFNGGAEKISKTFKGQFSTMLGLTSSTFSSMGRMILEPLAGPLSKVNEKLLKVSDGMNKLKDGVLSGEIPNPFTSWTEFSAYAKDNQGKGNPIIDMAAKSAHFVDKLKVIFDKVSEFMAPIIDSVKNIAKSFMDFFSNPAVQGALETWGSLLGDVCQTAFDWLDKLFRFIADNAEPIGNFLNYIGEVFTFTWELISGALEIAWLIIEPILSLFMKALGGIYGFLANTFSKAGDIIKGVFDAVKKPLEWMTDLFKNLSDAIGSVLGGIGKFAKTSIGKAWGNVSDFFGGDDYNKNGRAVGRNYVPYNGYKASLHRDEAILTAQEARAWREGRTGGGSSATSMSVNINVYESNNARETANEIVRQLQRIAPNMA